MAAMMSRQRMFIFDKPARRCRLSVPPEERPPEAMNAHYRTRTLSLRRIAMRGGATKVRHTANERQQRVTRPAGDTMPKIFVAEKRYRRAICAPIRRGNVVSYKRHADIV